MVLIYINDLPRSVSNEIKLYADDSKILAIINNNLDTVKVQDDLDSICEWTNKWLMQLSVEKCKVMHYGKSNPCVTYEMSDNLGGVSKLSAVEEERDLGVIFRTDLSWSSQINKVTATANRVLGMLRKTFVCKEANLWRQLYISLVRPHLEYAVQVWSPILEKEINALERVQARATKIPESFREMSYEERLDKMHLTKLSKRRERGDLIEMYKVMNGLEAVKWVNGINQRPSARVEGPASGLRGHMLQLEREVFGARLRNDFGRYVGIRHAFFSNRVVPLWNSLPQSVVGSHTLGAFKESFDLFSVTAATAH